MPHPPVWIRRLFTITAVLTILYVGYLAANTETTHMAIIPYKPDTNGNKGNFIAMTTLKSDMNQSESSNLKTILFWHEFYPHNDWLTRKIPSFFDGCEHKCIATRNRSQLNNAHAVAFYTRDLKELKFMPKRIDRNQLWIMYFMESPVHVVIPMKRFNGVFNATMTYKRESDIYFPQAEFMRNESSESTSNFANYAAGKTGLVSWFVSHCSTQSKRENFVEQLKKVH